jgi:hypothetical protein
MSLKFFFCSSLVSWSPYLPTRSNTSDEPNRHGFCFPILAIWLHHHRPPPIRRPRTASRRSMGRHTPEILEISRLTPPASPSSMSSRPSTRCLSSAEASLSMQSPTEEHRHSLPETQAPALPSASLGASTRDCVKSAPATFFQFISAIVRPDAPRLHISMLTSKQRMKALAFAISPHIYIFEPSYRHGPVFVFFVSLAYRYRQVQTSFREEFITLVVQSLLSTGLSCSLLSYRSVKNQAS